MTPAVLGVRLRIRRGTRQKRRVFRDRDVEIDRIALDRELKPRRHHADDRIMPAIKINRTAENAFVAVEMFPPEIVTDHDLESTWAAAGLFVLHA